MDKKQENRALITIAFTVFIDLLGFSIVIPILAPLLALPFGSQILPDTPYDQRLIIFGFLIASYAIAQFFAAPLIGQLSDRFGRKPLLAISLIGTLIARVMFIYGILQANLAILFISRIVDGITGGNISVAQSSVSDISTQENRVKNFGLLGATFGLGFVLGPYIGGRLGDITFVSQVNDLFKTTLFTTSTLPLWFATILCAINIILLWRLFPETLKEKINKPLKFTTSVINVVNAFRLPNLRVIFFSVFLFTLGFSFLTQFLSVYIGTKFEPQITEYVKDGVANGSIEIKYPAFPQEIESIPVESAKLAAEDGFKTAFAAKYEAGLIAAETQKRSADAFSYIGIWIVIAQAVIVQRLSKKFKAATLFKWGTLGVALSTLVLLAPDKIEWLFIILPLIAITNGIATPNSTALVSNTADQKSQGEVLGVNASVQSLAQALPSIASGYLAGKLSLGSPIFVGAVVVFLAFIFFAIFYKEKTKEVLHEE